jgi:hypothetical protein
MVDMRWGVRDKKKDDEKEIFTLKISGAEHKVWSEGQDNRR